MRGILIEQKFKYDAVVLPESNVEVTGIVYTREGKVYRTEQVNCKATIDGEEKRWNFTLVQPSVVVGPGVADGSDEAWKAPEFKTPAWPSGVSADKTVEEFEQYIAADIA